MPNQISLGHQLPLYPEKEARQSPLQGVSLAVSCLLVPSSALYCAANHERQKTKRQKLTEFESALSNIFQKGFSAAIALRSLHAQDSGDDLEYSKSESRNESGGSK